MTKKIGKYKPIKTFIMKKSLVILSVAALAFVGCNKNGGNDTIKPIDATLGFNDASVELVYG